MPEPPEPSETPESHSAEVPLALGIDLGGTKIEALLLSPDGGERWRERVPMPAADYHATLDALRGLVQRARQAAGGAPLTIGLGTPGSLTAAGVIKNSNAACLNGRPLPRDLESLTGQPVRVANDANCLALSEATDGAAAGAGVVFAAILGTGVGAGIVVHGHVLTGPNGLAGEWGHNPLPWPVDEEDPDLPCHCGRRGCAETLLSGPGVARDHERRTGKRLDAESIARAAAAGDAACQATLARHRSRLARGLAAVINLLDPDVIVLGGGLSKLPGLTEAVSASWGRWVFAAGADDPVRTRLVCSRHGDASGVRGAAWLWR